MKGVWAEMQEQSRAEGKAEGIDDAQKNFVLNMLKAGKLALNDIAEYSGMTLARVQELAKAL
ncbi:MAG: hypothetical protein IJM40_04475 [Synergistaceae bacterium]|nr:hypothetical protein [Synergistaceae bacterium]